MRLLSKNSIIIGRHSIPRVSIGWQLLLFQNLILCLVLSLFVQKSFILVILDFSHILNQAFLPILKIDFRFNGFPVQYLLLFLTNLDHIPNLLLLINSPVMRLIHLPFLLLPPFLSILDHLGSLLNINLLP